jgi:hypothetical protein
MPSPLARPLGCSSRENLIREAAMTDERTGASVPTHKAGGRSADEHAARDGAGEPAEAGWRSVLRDHALLVWEGQAPGALRSDSLTKSLGPLADDALRIVEGYALGARVDGATRSPTEFATRLDLILNA